MEVIPYETRLRLDRIWARKQIDSFFMRSGPVYQALEDLTRKLEDAGIPYALVGALALGEHGLERATSDVDILVTKQGLAEFRERYEGLGYVPAFAGARKKFRSTETSVSVDFITAGEYPGDGKPKAIVFPDPAQCFVEIQGIRVIRLEKFIELKLASGLTGQGRLKDLADVQELIRHAKLPASIAESLDVTVRPEYTKLWLQAQTPDFHNEEPPSS
jgi:hypothetical protein